jgi:hypothetical protein
MSDCGLPALIDAAAASGVRLLDPDAIGRIARFIDSCRCPEGGYRGRSTTSDLYYTQFALAVGQALARPVPEADIDHVASLADGAGLDFVHRAALGRCQGLLAATGVVLAGGDGIRQSLARFRTPDGGYAREPDAAAASPYDTFLAAMAGAPLSAASAKFASLPADSPTPVLAAALSLAAALGTGPAPGIVPTLLRRAAADGGFHAVTGCPQPDLLSTAVALFALRLAGTEVPALSRHLAFVVSLWNDDGGFSGAPADVASDCEYTFYALLALGAAQG